MELPTSRGDQMRKIVPAFLVLLNIVEIILYLLHKRTIDEDMAQWKKYHPYPKEGILSLNYLLWFYKSFRAVFIYRTIGSKRALYLLKPLLKRPPVGIEIDGKIGGGLLITHNMGCIINVASAGKNLSVAQGVTIGAGKADSAGRNTPIIGDNVSVLTNSVLFGAIQIGNNVKIGAGTILNKSVPDNCTVVGNPARIVSRDGIKCDERL